LPRLDARTVLQGAREVILMHGAEEYRLKVTASGKLILTK
jgi:Hemin uptake protein